MITYRKAEQKDENSFIKMERAFYGHYDILNLDKYLKPILSENIEVSFLKKAFNDYLNAKDSLFLVAEDENQMIAYMAVEIYDVYDNEVYNVKKSGHIDSIFVLEEYRNKGIGKELMNKAIEWIKSNDINMCTLGVSPDNTDAVNFYKDYGFSPAYLKMYKEI